MTSQRILITGTSTGFGNDAARALAAKGHTVFASMRGTTGKNADAAAALRQFASDGGHALHVVELDVTDDASVAAAVATATADGPIDVLINNAGVGTWGLDEGFDVEQARTVYDVNVHGVMRVNHAVLPHMRKAGKGRIIYISSGLGRIVLPFLGIYTSSKWALEGYAESLSYELGRLGIESCIIQPGAMGTPFHVNAMQPATDLTGEYGPTADFFAAYTKGFMDRAESGSLGDASEVTTAIVEEVERTDAGPMRRRCVGDDVKQGVEPINQAAAGIQAHLDQAMNLRD